MVLNQKDNGYVVAYALVQIPLQWHTGQGGNIMHLCKFYEMPLRLLHLILLDKRSRYKQKMIGKGEIIATR